MSEVTSGDQFKSDLDTVVGSVHTGKGDIRNTYVLQLNLGQDEPLGPRFQDRPGVYVAFQPQGEIAKMHLDSEIGRVEAALIHHRDAMFDIWDMSHLHLERAERYHKQEMAELRAELEQLRAKRERLSKLKLMEERLPATIPPTRPYPTENPGETVNRPPSLPDGLREIYAVEIVGDSMIDAGIRDGDVVLVRDQKRVEDGEIAVIRLRDTGEMTLKRFYQEERGQARLQPANRGMQPMYVDLRRVEVRGKFIRVLPQDGV